MEQRIFVGDFDGADGARFELGEPAVGNRTKDGASEELGGGAESLTGSG